MQWNLPLLSSYLPLHVFPPKMSLVTPSAPATAHRSYSGDDVGSQGQYHDCSISVRLFISLARNMFPVLCFPTKKQSLRITT